MPQLLAERETQIFEVHVPVLVHTIATPLCASAPEDLRDTGQRSMIPIIDAPDGGIVVELGLLDNHEPFCTFTVVDIVLALVGAINPTIVVTSSLIPAVRVKRLRLVNHLILFAPPQLPLHRLAPSEHLEQCQRQRDRRQEQSQLDSSGRS